MKYRVAIERERIEYSSHIVEIEADSQEEANEKVLENAHNDEYDSQFNNRAMFDCADYYTVDD